MAENDPDYFEDEYAESSAESVSSDGIDPLLGTRILTSVGPGIVDEIREYEGMHYCLVRLDTFGTVNIMSKSAEALLRKERKLSPQKSLSSSGNGGYKNVKGYIRMYNPAKGWGFIVCEEFEGDIFLHSKHMITHAPREYIGHFHSNQTSHQVKFDLDTQHRSRPQALNVRLLSESEQPAAVMPKKKLTRPGLKSGASAGPATAAGEGGPACPTDADNDVSLPAVHSTEDAAEPGAAGQGSAEEGGGEPPSAVAADAAADDEQMGAPSDEGSGGLWTGTGPVPSRLVQKRGILRMRGLPFTATTSDVAQFFDGFGVRPEDVSLSTRADGLTNGEAHVQFNREELAARALKERNMSNMGHRYIELFPTKIGSEANTGIAAATGPSPALTPQPAVLPLPHAPGIVSGPTTGQPVTPGLQNMQAVMAGAAAPAPAVAAAATYAAKHAAAAHSAQVVQVQGLEQPALGSGIVHGQAAAIAPNEQSLVYQQYFQHYQQVYAAAAASQAVQAAAAAAAQQAAAQQFQPQLGSQPLLPQYDYAAASAAATAETAAASSDGASTEAVTSSANISRPPEAQASLSEGGSPWQPPAGVEQADVAAAGVQGQGVWHGTPRVQPQEASTAAWWGTAESGLPAQQQPAAGVLQGTAPPLAPPAMPAPAPAAVSAGNLPGYSEARPQYYNEI